MDPFSLLMAGGGLLNMGTSIWSSLVAGQSQQEAAGYMQDAAMQAQQSLVGSRDQALSLLAPFMQNGVNAGNALALMINSTDMLQFQRDAERAKLVSDMKKYGTPTDLASFPILTGPKASERRQTLYQQAELERQNTVNGLAADLEAFDAQTKLMQDAARKASETGGANLQASSLYKFQADIGTEQINKQLAARGQFNSGTGLRTLEQFIRGLGAEETQRQTDRLFSLYTTGAQAGGAGANLLSGFAGPIAGTYNQLGQAQAQAALGSASATQGILQGVNNAVTGTAGGLMSYNLFKEYFKDRNSSGVSTDGIASRPSGAVTSYQHGYGKDLLGIGDGSGFLVNAPTF